jgi:hypothetical protein
MDSLKAAFSMTVLYCNLKVGISTVILTGKAERARYGRMPILISMSGIYESSANLV